MVYYEVSELRGRHCCIRLHLNQHRMLFFIATVANEREGLRPERVFSAAVKTYMYGKGFCARLKFSPAAGSTFTLATLLDLEWLGEVEVISKTVHWRHHFLPVPLARTYKFFAGNNHNHIHDASKQA